MQASAQRQSPISQLHQPLGEGSTADAGTDSAPLAPCTSFVTRHCWPVCQELCLDQCMHRLLQQAMAGAKLVIRTVACCRVSGLFEPARKQGIIHKLKHMAWA